jgi:hypothetical protein
MGFVKISTILKHTSKKIFRQGFWGDFCGPGGIKGGSRGIWGRRGVPGIWRNIRAGTARRSHLPNEQPHRAVGRESAAPPAFGKPGATGFPGNVGRALPAVSTRSIRSQAELGRHLGSQAELGNQKKKPFWWRDSRPRLSIEGRRGRLPLQHTKFSEPKTGKKRAPRGRFDARMGEVLR